MLPWDSCTSGGRQWTARTFIRRCSIPLWLTRIVAVLSTSCTRDPQLFSSTISWYSKRANTNLSRASQVSCSFVCCGLIIQDGRPPRYSCKAEPATQSQKSLGGTQNGGFVTSHTPWAVAQTGTHLAHGKLLLLCCRAVCCISLIICYIISSQLRIT